MSISSNNFANGNLASLSSFPLYKSVRIKWTMHRLKFKSTELIRLVEQRPMLWDRTCVQYVNKISKDEAWNEIYNELYPNYNAYSREEQRILGATITAKWRNLRDAFIRSVKRKQSAEQNYEVAKNYIYYEHLKFLLHRRKCKRDNTVTQSNIDYVENTSQESIKNDISPIQMLEHFDGAQVSHLDQHALGSMATQEELDPSQLDEPHHLLQQQQEQQDDPAPHHFLEPQQELYHLPDEDTAFFASIINSVRDMSEDEKIDFRIGSLELIRKIKQTRKAEQLKRLQVGRNNSNHAVFSQNTSTAHEQSGGALSSSSVKQEIE